MKKKSDRTPDSKIKAALRKLWLYSRERGTALKREKYTCQKCNKKKSKEVKLHVHHQTEIDWKKLYRYIRSKLLCDSNKLEVLCVDCHNEVHYGRKKDETNTNS